jgi:hypothetical protein
VESSATRDRKLEPAPTGRRAWWVGAGVAAVCLATRLPFLEPAAGRVFNGDELLTQELVLGRFLGVHQLIPWPAGPLAILSVPLVLLDYLRSSHGHLDAQGFVAFLQLHALDPWPLVRLLRAVIAAGFSVGVGALAVATARLTGSLLLAGAVALGVATVPQLWLLSHTATPHCLGFGLACIGMLALVPESGPPAPLRWFVAGTCLALGLTSHVTLASVVPVAAGFALQRQPTARLRGLSALALGLLVGALIGSPYVWQEPLRLAKSLAGATAAGVKGSAVLSERIWFVLSSLGPTGAALLLSGLPLALVRRRLWLAAGAIVSAGMMLLPALTDSRAYPRYFLPLVLVGFVAWAGSVDWPDAWSAARRLRTARVVGGLLALAIVALQLPGYAAARAAVVGDRGLVAAAAALRGLPDGARVVAPFEVGDYLRDRTSSDSFVRSGQRAAAANAAPDPRRFPAGNGGQVGYLIAHLPWNFTERVEIFAAMQTLRGEAPRPGLDLTLWSTGDNTATRFALSSEEEAARAFSAGAADAAVLRTPLPDRVPAARLPDGLLLYLR